MRVVVITKEATDYARSVSDYVREFKSQTGHDLEQLDPDTAEGTMFANTYDIVQYPTIIAVSDDGVMQNMWVGQPLPTISEVSYYV